MNKLWLNLLEEANFSLCLNENDPVEYRFNTIIELLKSGRETFEVKIVEVDPKKDQLSNIAKAIDRIALSSLGNSPGSNLFQKIIASPNTMCLLAQERENFIACVYGTYLELPLVKFFHLNFLGRMIEYPSIHIIKKLQDEASRVINKFPGVDYLTLCVSAKNNHIMPIYKTLGFEEIEYIEGGVNDDSIFFYAKKINEISNAKPSSYVE